MGKTLKRQRQKQLREQQQQQQKQQQHPAKLPRLASGAPLHSGSSSSKFTSAVSSALQSQEWLTAVKLLEAMQQYGKVPKLGAVQRWVRDADQAGSEAITARVLDAILRCTVPPPAVAPAAAAGPLQGSVTRHQPWRPAAAPAEAPAAAEAPQKPPTPQQDCDTSTAGQQAPASGEAEQQQQQQQQQVQQHQEVESEQQQLKQEESNQQHQQHHQQQMEQQEADKSEQQQQQQQLKQEELNKHQQQQSSVPLSADELQSKLYEVPFESGAGGPDAIYAFPPNTIRFDPNHPPVQALPVPFVPGALLLQGVLSPSECKQIMEAAEAIGWHSDVDYTFGGATGDDGAAKQQQQQQEAAAAGSNGSGSAARGAAAGLAGLAEGRPAAGCVWLADESLLQPLYDRVAHLLPRGIEGGAFGGINARWRLYRYTPGAVYRPHVDGAWPGSGIDPASGQYVFDAYGDRWSRLTFLVYLNDDFEGGCTTYYTPSDTQVGVLDARGVVPVQGNVMVFPHGGTKGSLVHEGSAVTKGAKYVIRTDVLYLNTPAKPVAGRGSSKGSKGSKAGAAGGQKQLQM